MFNISTKECLDKPNLIGIFGPGRNGSTLLLRLLDGSSGLWVHPVEVNYLSIWKRKGIFNNFKNIIRTLLTKTLHGIPLEVSSTSLHIWVEGQIKEINNDYLALLEKPYEIKVNPLALLMERRIYKTSDFLQLFLEVVRNTYDQRNVKKPINVFKSTEANLPGLYEEFFPELRFIHIIRHPFANYASLKRTACINKNLPFWKVGWAVKGDVLKVFLEDRWIPHTSFALAKTAACPSKHMIILYENLLNQPEDIIGRICKWIGAGMPANPRELTALGGKIIRKFPDNPSQRGVLTPNKIISDLSKKFGYDDVLAKREKEFIRLKTQQLVQKLGYSDDLWEGNNLPDFKEMASSWLSIDPWEKQCRSYRLKYLSALIARRAYVFYNLIIRYLIHQTFP